MPARRKPAIHLAWAADANHPPKDRMTHPAVASSDAFSENSPRADALEPLVLEESFIDHLAEDL